MGNLTPLPTSSRLQLCFSPESRQDTALRVAALHMIIKDGKEVRYRYTYLRYV